MTLYRTAAGSTVAIFGKHHGISDIVFDWLEERACIEAHPAEDVGDGSEPMLTWSCECCGSGAARLVKVAA